MSQQCPCGQKGQWYPGVQQEASGQQVEGVHLASLLDLNKATYEILCPVLSPSVKDLKREGPAEGHKYGALNSAIVNFEFDTFYPFYYTQCHPSASSALLIPPEELVTVQWDTPVTGLIPPGFTYANDVTSLGLDQNLELLFVPQAAQIGRNISGGEERRGEERRGEERRGEERRGEERRGEERRGEERRGEDFSRER
ncbi:hypothetical protein HGM15179_011354 [Zosterops borbonicus]|uniref:Uncharacterized protein n=1 Tax=Zosterops borbonicus TaxID=364589 RepID=A0A8K1GCT3_9PASS|nr:hypothetical protein HGM15179_011354 [Zosterops borbonicus]